MKSVKNLIRKIVKEEFQKILEAPLNPSLDDLESTSKLPVKNKTFIVKAGSPLAHQIKFDIFDMIEQSYAKIGGNATINSTKDLNQYPIWFVADVDSDPEPDVIKMARMSGPGLKGSASGTDGTQPAKDFLFKINKDFYSKKGNWSEVSDTMAHILINKLNIPTVSSEEKVKSLLSNKAITWLGNHPEGKFPGTYGWYTREIGGKPYAKIIVGNV